MWARVSESLNEHVDGVRQCSRAYPQSVNDPLHVSQFADENDHERHSPEGQWCYRASLRLSAQIEEPEEGRPMNSNQHEHRVRDEASASFPKSGNARRKSPLLVGLVVALLLVLVGAGSWGVMEWKHRSAVSAYSAAVAVDRTAAADFSAVVDQAEKTLKDARAAGVEENDLQSLIGLLNESRQLGFLGDELNKKAATAVLEEKTRALGAHTAALNAAAEALTAETQKVAATTQSVGAEKARQNLADAIGGAEAALADASQVLHDSEGKVEDNQLRLDLESGRDGLRKQIDEAKALSSTADVGKLDQAAKNLDEAAKLFAVQIQAVKTAHAEWEVQHARSGDASVRGGSGAAGRAEVSVGGGDGAGGGKDE